MSKPGGNKYEHRPPTSMPWDTGPVDSHVHRSPRFSEVPAQMQPPQEGAVRPSYYVVNKSHPEERSWSPTAINLTLEF